MLIEKGFSAGDIITIKLSNGDELCVILKNYSVKFPTDVSWLNENSNFGQSGYGNFTPMKFDVETTWDVVYASSELPGQERIYALGK